MNVILEPVDYKHLSFLKYLRNLPDVMEFCRQPHQLNEVNQEDWLKETSRTRSMIPFIATDKTRGEGREWVGYCALSNVDHLNRRGECSYVIHPSCKDQGYGEEVVFNLLLYGFHTLNLHKIYSDTFDYNDAEIAFNEKLGFVRSGTNIDHYFKRGKFIASISMYIMRDKFDELNRDRISSIVHPRSKPL